MVVVDAQSANRFLAKASSCELWGAHLGAHGDTTGSAEKTILIVRQ